MSTKISWTDESWNPVIGCTKVSAGCDNCYAERMAQRQSYMECASLTRKAKYINVVNINSGWTGQVFCDESALDKPLHWKKPRRIFVCSMGDLFHEKVNAEFLIRVLNIMGGCQQHTFQVLTKRPEKMLKVMNLYYQTAEMVPKKFRTMTPYPNLWLGVTAENQEMADKRIPILLQIPAAVRFVSVEPMLGRIKLNHIKTSKRTLNALKGKSKYYIDGNTPYYGHFLNWVIVGCESIQGKVGRLHIPEILNNPMSGVKISAENIWRRQAIDIVNQCKAAGVPVFAKQIPLNGNVCKDVNLFPKELQYQQYPKACDEAVKER